MPATRYQVRKALAGRLDEMAGLRAHPHTPGQLVTPCVVVIEADVEFDQTMQRGSDLMTVRCRMLTSGDMRAAQDRADDLISQVRDWVDDDPTLGGLVHYARVARIRGETEGEVTVANVTAAVTDFEVEVLA